MDKQEPLSAPAPSGSSFFEEHILAELVIISWLLCLWERYLSLRQVGYTLIINYQLWQTMFLRLGFEKI